MTRLLRLLAVAAMAFGLLLIPSVASAKPVPTPPPSPSPSYDIMIENPDGSTTIQTMTPDSQQNRTAAAAAGELFRGTFDFKARLQGRNMAGANRYCNNWSINFVERSSTTGFAIELWRSGGSRVSTSMTYNPQTQRSGGVCFNNLDPRTTYFFSYVKTNDTGRMTGTVMVTT